MGKIVQSRVLSEWIEKSDRNLNPLLPSMSYMTRLVIFILEGLFIFILEGIIKKSFYERRDYELVDEKSLS